MGYSKEFAEYLKDINKEYSSGVTTEHTFRHALKRLVESLKGNIQAINEPKRIECGAPDYLVTLNQRNRRETIGYTNSD